MLIDLLKIEEVLQKQKNLDFMERGMQPSLTYCCFKGLGFNRTEEYCHACVNYENTCHLYLRSCEEIPKK